MLFFNKIITKIYSKDKYINSILQEKNKYETKCFELENMNNDFLQKNKELMISLKKREMELLKMTKDYSDYINQLKKIIYISKMEQKNLREAFSNLLKRLNKYGNV